ncbi:hypothetical protein O3U67_03040 [Brevundimonas diminuta]|uniref:hypothetical protein n=1 Tax=Brevundimonas diminuta TaxID=293 RepID=UPI0022AF9E53|nr:hypothetical protein [Brevundimonas diminuta]MCZ4107050.1 hypothetical protein [Brevundimonas diminuta]
MPDWGKGHSGGRLRPALGIAVALAYGYGAAECVAAVTIGSVALAANSIGHITFASVYLLLLLAPAPARRRALVIATSAILILPALIVLVEVWAHLDTPIAPSAAAIALMGAGACLVDLAAAALIAGIRPGGITFAAGLKALLWPRAITGPMIVLTALATASTGSAWHDFIIGLGIAATNLITAVAHWRTH